MGPDYFRTLRIDLVAGRPFEDRDDAGAAAVAIVNNTMAASPWSGAAGAIGKRIRVADGEWRTVIGVAADIKYGPINESPRPYFYLPFLQCTTGNGSAHARRRANRRAGRSGAGPRHGARRQPADPVQPKPLEDRMGGALLLFNLMAAMLFVFGVAGMALAAMGTYGLVSYTVSKARTRSGSGWRSARRAFQWSGDSLAAVCGSAPSAPA